MLPRKKIRVDVLLLKKHQIQRIRKNLKEKKVEVKVSKSKPNCFDVVEVNLNMDTQIPQEDEDNNNGSASDKSPSIPSTSINTHTESSTGSAELKCIIGHEIGEFQKSLNSEISTFIIKKDQEVKQYKSKIENLEKMRCEENKKLEVEINKLKTELLNLKKKQTDVFIDKVLVENIKGRVHSKKKVLKIQN